MPNQYLPTSTDIKPPENILQELTEAHPEVAEDIRAVQRLYKVKEDRNSDVPEENIPFDVGVLAEFTYEGKHLTEAQTSFILQFLMEGFPRSTNRFPLAKDFPPIVLAAIQEVTKAARKQIKVNPHRVMRTLGNIMDANIADILDVVDGRVAIKDFASLPREVTAGIKAIHEVRNPQGTQIRVEMHNSMDAAIALSRILGMQSPQKLELDLSDDLTKRLDAALARTDKVSIIEGEVVHGE